MRSVTTVIAKAPSRDLTTLETAKDELQITGTAYDKRLRRWIREESGAIERYCGRRLVKETLQQRFETTIGHPAGVSSDLVLELYPVSEVLSVTWNNTELTPDEWQLDGEAGLLRRYDEVSGTWMPWWGYYGYYTAPYPSVVIVQYIGGYTLGGDLPPDLEAAALIQLQHRKSTGTRDQTIKSESVPNVLTTTYYVPGIGENAAIVPAAAARLEPYRELRI
jgi:hypothetical protein